MLPDQAAKEMTEFDKYYQYFVSSRYDSSISKKFAELPGEEIESSHRYQIDQKTVAKIEKLIDVIKK